MPSFVAVPLMIPSCTHLRALGPFCPVPGCSGCAVLPDSPRVRRMPPPSRRGGVRSQTAPPRRSRGAQSCPSSPPMPHRARAQPSYRPPSSAASPDRRMSDRHRVHRHLPLRHPRGARRLGPVALPARAGPRDHRHGLGGRSRGHPFAVGDRVGVGCLVNSCGECGLPARPGAVLHVGAVGTYGDTDLDGTVTQGGYSRQIVVTDPFVVRIPDAHAAGPRRAAAVRRHHDVRAAAALEGRSRQAGRGRRPRRARPHRGEDRARARRRGHRALAVAAQEGRGPAARRGRLPRDDGPGDVLRGPRAPST